MSLRSWLISATTILSATTLVASWTGCVGDDPGASNGNRDGGGTTTGDGGSTDGGGGGGDGGGGSDGSSTDPCPHDVAPKEQIDCLGDAGTCGKTQVCCVGESGEHACVANAPNCPTNASPLRCISKAGCSSEICCLATSSADL